MRKARLNFVDELAYVLSTFSLVLIIIWLLRSPLQISQYSRYIVYAVVFLMFFSKLLQIKVGAGVTGLVSSFASAVGSLALEVSIMFFVGSYLGLEQEFTRYILPLFLTGVILLILSWKLGFIVPLRKTTLRKEIYSFESKGMQLGENLKVKAEEIIGLPIEFGNILVGCVAIKDLDLDINTTIGKILIPIKTPTIIFSSSLRKKNKIRDASTEEYESAKSLYMSKKDEEKKSIIKLPFIEVEEYGDFYESVRFGPIRVSEEGGESKISITPFINIVESGKDKKKALVLSNNKKKVIVKLNGKKVKASWDGWKLVTDGESYTFLRKGSVYAKDSIDGLMLKTMNYTLKVSESSVSVDIPGIKLVATPKLLVLSSGSRSQRIEDQEISRRFIESVARIIRNQVSDLLNGIEPDIADVYAGIDSILKKVGG
ncbi:MAG: hypothetical protein JTT16_01155 [Candidatus Brockarchaeota archaeon]|nr:hypothetical protein [Candidatus Brockarchaeota archaeon]